VAVAKNYLNGDELASLSNLVEQYLIFAEGQAMRRIPMHMQDWIKKLDAFLNVNDREILKHAGRISHDMAQQLADGEYESFRVRRIAEHDKIDNAFDSLVGQLPAGKPDQAAEDDVT